MVPRRFVIGDIHGAYRALVQCFEKAAFDAENDLLICLGDVCDRWPEVDKVMDALLQVRNLVLLLGNHDLWALEWFLGGKARDLWLLQGGKETMDSYVKGIPEDHLRLLQGAGLYYVLDNKLFVHGGYKPESDILQQPAEVLLWDRSLVHAALNHKNLQNKIKITGYDEVYVGHTPTLNYGTTHPIKACEVYMLDTGAGWPGGVLTMMDIDSKAYYQSEITSCLYRS
jgi:serine/threonine protein phosphatase 1